MFAITGSHRHRVLPVSEHSPPIIIFIALVVLALPPLTACDTPPVVIYTPLDNQVFNPSRVVMISFEVLQGQSAGLYKLYLHHHSLSYPRSGIALHLSSQQPGSDVIIDHMADARWSCDRRLLSAGASLPVAAQLFDRTT